MKEIKIKKITPMFNTIITTMDKYEEDGKTAGGLIDVSKREGELKEYQRVIAVGNTVKGIEVGDFVAINPTRYAVRKHRPGTLKDGIVTDNPIISYNFNVIEVDGKDCLKLFDSDIDFIIDEYEEVEASLPPKIEIPEKKIIL